MQLFATFSIFVCNFCNFFDFCMLLFANLSIFACKIGCFKSFTVKCARKCNLQRINATFAENKCNFLALLLQQKLGLLMSQKFLLTQIISFEPETLAGHPKYQNTQDCSLVSNKNFSKILPSNGWRPEPGEVGHGGQTVLHLWHHSQKTRNPQPKKFIASANYKTCRIFWHFDQVHKANRSGDIPVQSHVRSSCFFAKRLN